MLRTVLLRPLTRACWRETLYLLLGLFTGTVAFTVVVTGIATAAGLSMLILGLPLAALAAHINRWLCELDRGRAALVLGERLPARYEPPVGKTQIGRWVSVLRDRQTWRDAVWLFGGFPVTVAGFVVAVGVWAGAVELLAFPLYGWTFPDHDWVGRHELLLGLVGPPIGLVCTVLAAWIVRGVALLQVRMATALLAPSRAEALERRVEALADTRAGAVEAATTELQRVERDLHDGAQARLVALSMDLGLAEQRLAAADAESARSHVAAAKTQAREAMAELRDLVRGIGPSILRDRGLDAALTALVAGRTPPVDLRVEVARTDVGARETAAYFVVAEALANARKHASADRVSVRVWEDAAGRLVVEVLDDGVGGADLDAGSGLSGLRKRIAALDGVLEVASPVGGPTTVRAVLPCAS
jgi:signal transduction histidine kinase